ncbi:MAG: NAD-dependent epimerase/dehydratase family protein [Anaerolineae bacterium]|nr:NAD-dependent epimerase/dehydratase family protein [Anaerolineae bacterium]
MGFIGSNLAIALVKAGADVTITDAMIPDFGGNLFNIEPIRDQVVVNFCDIRDAHVMNYLVRNQDYVFHLAGQVDHIASLTDPFPDIDMNIKGTAVLMEACKHHNPQARVVHVGTRGQYGPAVSLPVSETAPTYPKGIYEISRLAAEKITQVYNDIHGIRSIMLRLTNVYGPRAQMKHARYGVANWFVRLAIDDDTIKVFGDGLIKRDFLYVDDCVQAMLMATQCEAAYGEIFNVGVDQPTNFKELAESLVRIAGTGRWEYAPFTPERAAQDPGDFYSDISKICRIVGWEPATTLDDGLIKTLAYYRQYKHYYW